ncbi:MAG TPA: hypothetical protein VER58_12385 [Thermoanaerobaculia bacterium]|nr:hypothetical protein [Thermoanaerobaculia bacterium]
MSRFNRDFTVAVRILTVITCTFFAGNAFAQCRTERCLRATAWLQGYTAIITTNATETEARAARDFAEQQGARIAVITPRIMLGWVNPALDRTLIGQHGILAITRAAVDARSLRLDEPSLPQLPFLEKQAGIALRFFNAVVSGEIARQKEAALQVTPRPITGCISAEWNSAVTANVSSPPSNSGNLTGPRRIARQAVVPNDHLGGLTRRCGA